jgi:hypothetical protein
VGSSSTPCAFYYEIVAKLATTIYQVWTVLVPTFTRWCGATNPCIWWCLCCNVWGCWLIAILVAIALTVILVIFILMAVILVVLCWIMCIIGGILSGFRFGNCFVPQAAPAPPADPVPPPPPVDEDPPVDQ